VKTIIEEAIQAFEDLHNDRCLSAYECDHIALIVRARDYEAGIEKRIKSELAVTLAEERDRWVFGKSKSSFAEWVESIFNNTIRFLEGK